MRLEAFSDPDYSVKESSGSTDDVYKEALKELEGENPTKALSIISSLASKQREPGVKNKISDICSKLTRLVYQGDPGDEAKDLLDCMLTSGYDNIMDKIRKYNRKLWERSPYKEYREKKKGRGPTPAHLPFLRIEEDLVCGMPMVDFIRVMSAQKFRSGFEGKIEGDMATIYYHECGVVMWAVISGGVLKEAVVYGQICFDEEQLKEVKSVLTGLNSFQIMDAGKRLHWAFSYSEVNMCLEKLSKLSKLVTFQKEFLRVSDKNIPIFITDKEKEKIPSWKWDNASRARVRESSEKVQAILKPFLK